MVMQVGLKNTGLWSFLSSITAITGLGSFGFASALLYFTPKYKMEENSKKLNSLINTTLLSSFFLTAILCIISYIVFALIIPVTLDGNIIELAFRILPFVVVSFLFYGLAASCLFILDGLILMHVRAKIIMTSSIVFLVTGTILLFQIGIIGIAVAQLVQNILMLILSYKAVEKHIPFYKFRLQFNQQIFKTTFSFGFNYQIISISQIVSEPFLKSMITKFAGSEITAIFDFCVKLLNLFRNLMIAANQTIVPRLTIFKVKGYVRRLKIIYMSNFSLVLFLGILFFLTPVVFSDAIALFILGTFSSEFNFVLINVSVGFLANALAFPAHFQNMGTGMLKWNVISNIIAAILILSITPVLGVLVGGDYLIIGWTIASVIASVILIGSFGRENDVSVSLFFGWNTIQLAIAIIFAIILSRNIYIIFPTINSFIGIIGINLVILILCIFYPVFQSRVFKKLIRKIRISRRLGIK